VRYGHRASGVADLTGLYERTRAEGFGREVKRRIMIGTIAFGGYYDAYYLRAQRVRTLIARDFADVFQRCDVLLTPATPCPAFAVRRENRRSCVDVFERCVHRDGQSRRAPGHFGAGRSFHDGCPRASNHRQGI